MKSINNVLTMLLVTLIFVHSAMAGATELTVISSPTGVTVNRITNVTFTVTDAGTAISGVTVTLTGAGISKSGITDANGKVFFPVNATGAGTVIATATMSGYITGTVSLNVTATFNVNVYDINGTPGIQKDEAVNAVNDYLSEDKGISKLEATAVVLAYVNEYLN